MQPLKLEITAIGPFAEKTVIEFDKIDKSALFLIHGATGSGKSYIFDAICFALYGETPSKRTSHLRSDYADASEQPRVSLTFALGSKVYQVTRTLEYERPKKRGTGTTTEKDTQTLLHWSAWPDGDSTTLAATSRTVDSQVHQLIGLDLGQFSRVVMLPQGQFRRLLLDSNAEREALLEHLFDADFYQGIQDWFREEKIKVEDGVKTTRIRIKELLDASRPSIPEDQRPPDDEEIDPAHLLEAAQAMEQQIETLAGDVKTGGMALESAIAQLKAGEILRGDFASLETHQKALNQLHLEQPVIETLGREHQAALAAQKIAPHFDRHERCGLRAKEDQHETTRATKRLEAAALQLKTATSEHALSEEMSHKRDSALGRVNTLTPLVDLSEQIEEASEHLSEIAKQKEEIGAAVDSTNAALTALEAQIEADKQTLESVRSNAADHAQLTTRLALLKQITALDEEISKHRNRLKGFQTELANATTSRDKIARELLDLEQRRENSMAGELASQLVSGKPCPVCGSAEHPHPADTLQTAELRDEIAHKKEALAEADKAVGDASQNATKTEADLERILQNQSALTEAAALDDAAAAPAELKIAKKALAAESARQKQEQKLAIALEKKRDTELPKARAHLEETRQRLNAIEKKLQANEGGLNAKRTQMQQAIDGLGDEFKDQSLEPRAIVDSMKQARDEKIACDKEIDRLSQSLKSALATMNETAGLESALKSQLQKSREELLESERLLNEALESSLFPNLEDFIQARRDESWVEQAKQRINGFDRNLHDTNSALNAAKSRIDGRPLPDMVALESAKNELQSRHNTTQARLAEQRAAVNNLKTNHQKTEALVAQNKDALARLTTLGRLADQVRGQSQPKISFKRYFLAQRLDEVLTQASRRMDLLSNGRFVLKRALEGRDKKSQAGLDLQVCDAYTGTVRPVSTLSGGQLFLASLSMALGLADVIQARAGAINLDTLFIDEGFGSLDEETLQTAMQVLNDLRDGRMVGVISHISDLKRQIATNIEVHQTHRGSTASLHVGR